MPANFKKSSQEKRDYSKYIHQIKVIETPESLTHNSCDHEQKYSNGQCEIFILVNIFCARLRFLNGPLYTSTLRENLLALCLGLVFFSLKQQESLFIVP